MKPLLDVLVILDALEKEGSFAAASAKLYKTPSALSYTIHKLESDLNIQLLDRSGHRARFTPTGQMLLEKGREVLHTVRELEKQAMKHYRAIVSGGEWPPVDDQESLVTYDFAGQLMLISAGLGWGYVPRYLVQDQLESGELIEKEVASHLPAHRAWLGWNEDAAGLSCAWWRSEILANNAIHTIYDIKIV